jgi:hypothetical protein
MAQTPTFRIVRQTLKSAPQYMSPSFPHYWHEYEADNSGDWIEKDYGNGSLSYRMAVDCNPKAVAKLREAGA